MSADQEFKIRISTVTDGDASAAVQGLKNTGKAAEEAGDKFKVFETHGRELQKLFGELDKITPGLGLALHAAFSPTTLGISDVVPILEQIVELFKRDAEAAREMAAAISSGVDNADYVKGLNDLQKAMLGAGDEGQKFEESLKNIASAQESLLTGAEKSISLFKQQAQAEQDESTAKKQILFAEIKAKEQLGEISKGQAEEALAGIGSQSEREANERRQRARKDEIDDLQHAQNRNRSDFSAAHPAAEAAISASVQAELNELRRKFIVDQANKTLDENNKGSVAAQLNRKQAELDKIPLVAQHDPITGQKDDADNLKIQIESLTRLKAQAGENLRKFGTPEAEFASSKAVEDSKQASDEARKKAQKLEEENNQLTDRIRDLENRDSIATPAENVTAAAHARAGSITASANNLSFLLDRGKRLQSEFLDHGPNMDRNDMLELLGIMNQLGQMFREKSAQNITKQEFQSEIAALKRLIESKGK